MGLGSILLGSNIAQYRIWDGMRAIDYLQSRDDIIAERIGCTGNSGGGTLTAYLMALDDRIVAAAPVCYLTTFRKLIDTRGAQDGVSAKRRPGMTSAITAMESSGVTYRRSFWPT